MMLSRITDQEKVDLAKNLALMLKSGVAINEALTSLEKQARRRVTRRVIRELHTAIEEGMSLAHAFEKHQTLFGSVFVSLVRTGETSGTLEENLRFLARWLEQDYTLRQEITAATLYPKIVLAVSFLVGSGLALFVLPRFIPLFAQLSVDLPLFTRILLHASLFMQHYGFFVVAGIAGVVVGYAFLLKIVAVRRVVHRTLLGMPMFGSLLTQYQLAIMCQLFYTLMKSGVPISETLEIVRNACTNLAYQDSLKDVRERVIKGTPLSDALCGYPHLYPHHVLTMITVGEKSGTLDTVFNSLAEHYAKEVLATSKKLPTIIEPLLLVVIALVVGGIAVAVIFPIYQLTQGLLH